MKVLTDNNVNGEMDGRKNENCKRKDGWTVFPDSHFGTFYRKNLVPDPKKLGERALSDAYIVS